MTERLFKVLGDNRTAFHGGRGVWKARAWMPPIDKIKPCQRGYHLCREQDLLGYLGQASATRSDECDDGCVLAVRQTRRPVGPGATVQHH